MNNDSFRLRHTQKQESTSEQKQQQKTEAKEFSTVEEILREDSSQTVVPPGIAVRLNESISKLPRPTSSWWRRIFSRK